MNAADWLGLHSRGTADMALLGAPISRASISPSEAWSTPPAFRRTLRRFSTWDAEHEVDLSELLLHDAGDVIGDRDDGDIVAAHGRIQAATMRAGIRASSVVVVGGDNSLTRPVLHGLMSQRPDEEWGLLTIDAHHDCRPLDQGPRNGTPVRELIEAGLPGDHVAQVGIQPFANERDQAEWARSNGVHVYPRAEVASTGMATTLTVAVTALARAGVTAIHVDLDLDACDRSVAPACPASLPGGITASELLTAARHLGRERRVHSADLTEVDANADLNDITIRLMAAAFLAFCSGRLQRPPQTR